MTAAAAICCKDTFPLAHNPVTSHFVSGPVRFPVDLRLYRRTGTYAVLVTNRVDWTAQRIIATYLQRWPIETFYQDGNGQLGVE